MDRHLEALGRFTEPLGVRHEVLRCSEARLPVIAALNHVLRDACRAGSDPSCHVPSLVPSIWLPTSILLPTTFYSDPEEPKEDENAVAEAA